ncbi:MULTISPECIES: two-component system response regulator GlrR [Halomonas]|uniref:two-component system response regulator GlrR n=1 Tax=Halomonas TaxID=2745 RepID=UPI001C97C165|nr:MULTISPECIES: two-component system response regulator GlrR [Halomonas]MBY5927901.1 two-component system response regulator GlrR [Halomonas sp. DP8Y7-3]MBY5983052.1 two-component system response regulator GlrR [Halomonas sp. DP5Y7-2]MBY6209634.1 two-component system response regulator GlrR [Halomonas sp. DP3Y7-2]MBY6226815.1 two-component system response regulator GlrR [Halomonas sp. DP3Y7-1]MCA0915438.1 two-component system response regulator GlrR [Halomonas denitrificans]
MKQVAATLSAKTSAHVLLVDDDVSLLKLLGMRLESRGYRVTTAESGREALKRLEEGRPDLVLSDLRMDEMDGMALFQEIQRRMPGLPVIILTAHGSIPDAVSATRQGVFSFLTKPVDREELFGAIDDALSNTASGVEGDDSWREAIITRSPEMERILEQARMVAGSDVSVLVTGPSGSGKELLANAIHKASARADKPFIAINCGALPEQLLESELFGHAKGAFTGAISEHGGLFQAADGGTLFLDEIGDMPLAIQVKLLRVLQERQVRPVGSTTSVPVDVRVLSATHRDLDQAMHEGEFREDLYYRLNVVNLKLPALKDRAEDVPLLVKHLVAQAASRHKPFVKGFSPEALNLLATCAWPGNVRQLVNVVEQCVALSSAPMIPEALVAQALAAEDNAMPTFNDARAGFERSYLVKVLKITEGNVTQAARIAGRNRTDFYKLLSRHELEPASFKPGMADQAR